MTEQQKKAIMALNKANEEEYITLMEFIVDNMKVVEEPVYVKSPYAGPYIIPYTQGYLHRDDITSQDNSVTYTYNLSEVER